MTPRSRLTRDPCTVCFKRVAVTSCVACVGRGWCSTRLCEECAKPAPSGHGRCLCPAHAANPIYKSGDDLS